MKIITARESGTCATSGQRYEAGERLVTKDGTAHTLSRFAAARGYHWRQAAAMTVRLQSLLDGNRDWGSWWWRTRESLRFLGSVMSRIEDGVTLTSDQARTLKDMAERMDISPAAGTHPSFVRPVRPRRRGRG